MNAFGGEFLSASNVVDVIRITPVDDDVILFELAHQIVKRGIYHSRRNHEPDRPRLLELLDKIVERIGAGCSFAFELLHGVSATVIDDAFVAVFLQAPDHIGAHSSQPDHPELHRPRSSQLP